MCRSEFPRLVLPSVDEEPQKSLVIRLIWSLTLFSGMGFLLLGLNLDGALHIGWDWPTGLAARAMEALSLPFVTEQTGGALGFVVLLYGVGAIVLLVPPIIDRKAMVIILQAFLAISVVMFFWAMTWWVKIPVRIGLSLLVTGVIKYVLDVIPLFKWRYLIDPRYYWRVLKGEFAPGYAVVLGVDWLGIGYAFNFKIAFVIGALYLYRFAVLAWREEYAQTDRSNALLRAWRVINGWYTIYGTFFAVAEIVALCS